MNIESIRRLCESDSIHKLNVKKPPSPTGTRKERIRIAQWINLLYRSVARRICLSATSPHLVSRLVWACCMLRCFAENRAVSSFLSLYV